MLAFAIVVVLLLVVLNGLFAMTELAVVSSRKSKLQSRAERGDKGARAALKLARQGRTILQHTGQHPQLPGANESPVSGSVNPGVRLR